MSVVDPVDAPLHQAHTDNPRVPPTPELHHGPEAGIFLWGVVSTLAWAIGLAAWHFWPEIRWFFNA